MSSLPSAQILLLEKDFTNRVLFAEYLEQCGYLVFQLADERQVFESLEICQPQVLVLNLKMPAIDGFTIIEQVRAHVLWRSLPILAVTSYTLIKYQRRAYQLGANAYLTKPMAPSSLSAVIAQLVTQYSSSLADGLADGLADSFAENRYVPTKRLIAG